MSRDIAHTRTLTVTFDEPADLSGGKGTSVGRRRHRFGRRIGGPGFRRPLLFALVVAALAIGAVTVGAYWPGNRFGLDSDDLRLIFYIDIVLALALGITAIWTLVQVWSRRRAGTSGGRLHLRIAALFSVVAIAPAFLVALLAGVYFNLEVESWFNERVRPAVENSVEVANAYLAEHKLVIEADALAMAQDLNRSWGVIASDSQRVRETVRVQAAVRSLSEVMVFDSTGRVLARAGLTSSLEFDQPPFWALDRAAAGEAVVLTGDNEDRVRALVGLDTVPQTFLYVGRFVDPKVLDWVEVTQEGANAYERLKADRSQRQIQMAALFAVVALVLLLLAVGVGMAFANRLTRPIGRLVHATEMVRSGNLTVRVDETERPDDEIGVLTRAFNRMTRQLEEQRRELTEANRQLEDRRRFTEAVLGGVSAGVVGLDRVGRVNLPNRSAVALLDLRLDRLMGRPLGETVPVMAPLVAEAIEDSDRLVEDEVTVETGHGKRTLHVRIAAERDAQDQVIGFVVTFDDVTELLSAQRKAAWADVARRIAHEIKNPLTPIQLSAERLKRKYLKEIQTDPEIFSQCTDTIVRQVGDIGRMVDEFSAFARMPNPVMKRENLVTLCRDAVFLQQQAHPELAIETALPRDAVPVYGDARLLQQALTNLLQNAVDAIDGRDGGDAQPRGWIRITLVHDHESATVCVEDNGRGLPVAERDRLTEPYVTTRSKGTGLGLAIVTRIMEQHEGTIRLEDRVSAASDSDDAHGAGGAKVSLTIPLMAGDGQDPAGPRRATEV